MKKISSLILMGLSFGAGAETILNFNNITLPSLGVTYVGEGTTLITETTSVTTYAGSYSVTPRDGSTAAQIYLGYESSSVVYGTDALNSALDISGSEIINAINPNGEYPLSPTNFGFLSTTINLVANQNYSFYWATANSDYSPFSDGTFFALSLGTQLIKFDILSRLATSPLSTIIPGTTTGYQENTAIFQSYGASDWVRKTFTVAAGGNYRVAVGVFNSIDTLLSPYLFVSDLEGDTVPIGEATLLSFENIGPSVEDTNASLQRSAYQLRGAYNSQVAASNLSLNHDCNLFDTKGLCISAGGRYTTIDNPTTNTSAAVVSLGYKMNSNIRIGGFLDQNVNIQSPSSINIANKNPLMGLYAVWNKDTSGLGYQLRLANTYQDKDVTTTRVAYGDSGEAGSGTAKLNSQSYLAELSYAFQYQDKTLVRPYFGLRHTKLKRDGYSESSGAEYALTYEALNDRSTTALMGARVNYQVTPKTTLTANLGIEQDLHHNVGNLTASNFAIGDLTPIAFNSNIKRTRPVVSVGAFYDVTKAQRLSGTVTYQQLPFQSTGATSLYVNYMIGF
jgi:uncharacterized protein YhjY with autotransporter beta-barrel domain